MSLIDHRFEHESDLAVTGMNGPLGSGWFKRLSVDRKLSIAVFGNTLIMVLTAVVMLGGTWLLGQGGHAQAVLASVEVRTNNAAIVLVDVVEKLEAAEAAETPGERSLLLDQAQDDLTTADQMLADPISFGGDAMPDDIATLLTGFRADIAGLQEGIAADPSQPGSLAELTSAGRTLYGQVSSFAIDFHTRAATSADRLFKNISNFLLTFVILTVAAILISLLGARRVIFDVTGMFKSITNAMEEVSDGNAAREIPGAEREDEIGKMARALIVFRENMQKLRNIDGQRAQEVEEQLAQQQLLSEQMRDLRHEKSRLLEDLAAEFEVSVGELITAVSAASEQLRATSKQMVKLADGSNDQANGATEAMKHATTNVTAAAAATDEFALSISEISRQASSSAELARDASKLVDNANTRMSELSQAADEIGEIAGLIQTIAQRTNLLALNASIEAARGGEAGRGFAVVASEVKELAMQTSNATSSVAEKITAMQESTASSAGDLTSIVQQIAELEQAAVMIASAVDQQSVSGEELARNIDTVAAGSANVGERLEALRAASEETGNAADDVVSSANALGEHADALRTKAGRFIEDVRRSARELEAGEAA